MSGATRSGFADHVSEQAAGYAAHRPAYPAELADYLADLAPARALAWDAGWGSGQLASLLAAGVAGRTPAAVASEIDLRRSSEKGG